MKINQRINHLENNQKENEMKQAVYNKLVKKLQKLKDALHKLEDQVEDIQVIVEESSEAEQN